MSEQPTMAEIAAYINLLVHYAGGRVEMPYEFVEAGLPANSGLAIKFDDENEVAIFEIRSSGE
jgi:hypothetical protein